jgi:hypothetical protein
MSESRYATGGFGPRFVVTRTDGKPCRESARYFVLDISGADPHAVKAARAYAESVYEENRHLAAGRREVTQTQPRPELEPADTERQRIEPVLGLCDECERIVTKANFGAAFGLDILCRRCAAKDPALRALAWPNDGDHAGCVG